jgi:glycosyltransferase involved in cell wall biosynthesis
MASQPASVPVEVLVVANACTDRTVEVGRSFEAAAARIGWTLRVVDLPEPGKLNALNVGDAMASGDLRLYLDADVKVSPPLVRELADVLSATPEPRYASGRPRVSIAQTAVTRAYARFWQMLPFVRSEAPGFGVFAVNAAGRKRWDRFPAIISDDTYVRLQFSPRERVGVPATYEWPMVEGFSRLVKVRRRQDEGVKEIARKWPALLDNEGKSPLGMGQLVALALAEPLGFMVYAAVTLAVKSRKGTSQWTRGR